MIAKHIAMTNHCKSSIVRLVNYVTSDQRKAHRVGEIMITNCTHDDPDLAAREILMTQLKNRRAKSDKTYHLMVSFRPGEDPTPETLRRVEEDLCKRLRFGDHQRIAVVHRDIKQRRSIIRDKHSPTFEQIRAEARKDRDAARRIPAGRTAKRRLYAAIQSKYRARLDKAREESRRERQALYHDLPRLTWLGWLQDQAREGRPDALKALRSRAFGLAIKTGKAIRGEHSGTDDLLEGRKVDSVTKRGTVIYSIGVDALRDDGESFRISQSASLETAILALQVAKKRFGQPLHINGDSTFRETMVRAAVEGKVFVSFSDPSLEKQRKQLWYSSQKPKYTAKEIDHEK